MKLVATFLAVLGVSLSAYGSSVTLTNFAGPTSNLVADAGGNLLPNGSGYAAIGIFASGDADITGFADQGGAAGRDALAADFTQFANSVNIGFNNFAGIYQSVVTDAISAGDSFDGMPVYTVVGNASTLEASGQALVYKHAHNFAADPAPTANAVLGSSAGGTLLVGDFDKFKATLGPIDNQPAYSLHLFVPEPSTASFLGLGLGVLLLRRKR